MKTLQGGLGEILWKFRATISKSTQNLWFVSKLQNLNVRSSIKVFKEYLTCDMVDLTWFCFENELILQYERHDTNL